jgi:hypothetical protein
MNQASPPIWTEEPISYFVLFALLIVRFTLMLSAPVALGVVWFRMHALDHWKQRLSLVAVMLTIFDHQLTRLMVIPPRTLPIMPWIGWAALIALSVGLVLMGTSRDVKDRTLWSKIWSGIAALYAALLLPTWGG